MKKGTFSRKLLGLISGDDVPDFESSIAVSAPQATPRVDDRQLLLTVEQAQRRLAIGRSHLYQLLGRGELKSVRIGGSRRIPVAALDRYIERMLEDDETI
ncbi:MAG: helix-turn-helix domain-containing protein [Chloroflexi bacterium]|nr:MAG: helix-turn-helix domain-containing protein [Chloroflexota bacterium]